MPTSLGLACYLAAESNRILKPTMPSGLWSSDPLSRSSGMASLFLKKDQFPKQGLSSCFFHHRSHITARTHIQVKREKHFFP